MKKQQLMRAAATTVLGIGLTTGFAAAQTSGIDHTGASSDNAIVSKVRNSAHFNNDNDLRVRNDNDQDARSGRVEANRNTTAGNVGSGAASNGANTSTTVAVDNSAGVKALAGWGGSADQGLGNVTISNTGADSDNKVVTKVSNSLSVRNDNDIHVTNSNDQDAHSGNVEANRNTTVGNVTSGPASNTSTTSTEIKVTQ
jgi:hypothetical protein